VGEHGYIRSHEGLTVTAETRAALRELAERLARETPPKTILTCVQRISNQVRPGQFETFFTVIDSDTRGTVMSIPTKDIAQDVFANWLLLQVGNTCASCLEFLIDGEEGLCVTCESREVMELIRLRDDLG
jgi:hypothetical protein